MTSQDLIIEQKINRRITVNAGSVGYAKIPVPNNARVQLKGYGYSWYKNNTYTLSTGTHNFPSRSDQEGSIMQPMIYSTPFECTSASDILVKIENNDVDNHVYDVVFLLLSDRILQINSEGSEAITPVKLTDNIPLGGIIAWVKSFANVPALPEAWIECNGQTLSDGESVFDGQVIPDLNGDGRFLRGAATSGNTGGTSTHNHQWLRNSGNDDIAQVGDTDTSSFNSAGSGANINRGPAYTNKISSLPSYYEVVWIMKIKQ